MKSTGYFSHFSPAVKFFWLISILVIFAIISAFVGILAGKLMHIDMLQIAQLTTNPQPGDNLNFLYTFQFINQVGVFILAPLLYLFLLENPSPGRYLKLNRGSNIAVFLLAAVSIYTLLPFINFLSDWNAQLSLPKAFAAIQDWMVTKEAQADHITSLLLSVKTIQGLSLNLFVVALMPALGEELLFRGVLQQLFQKWTKSTHLGVIITAIIFSAIHLQFFGFFPRLILGLLLGYLFVYTKTLWVPIAVHFLNNASSVVIFYLNYNGYIHVKMEHFGSIPNFFGIAGSLIITIGIIYMVKKNAAVAEDQRFMP